MYTYLIHFYACLCEECIRRFKDYDFGFVSLMNYSLDEINKETIVNALCVCPFDERIYKSANDNNLMNDEIKQVMNYFKIKSDFEPKQSYVKKTDNNKNEMNDEGKIVNQKKNINRNSVQKKSKNIKSTNKKEKAHISKKSIN